MATPNPLENAFMPTADVSMQTIHMCGLMVDVYGLSELAPTATQISILWIHHPRLRSKGDMRHIACATLSAWARGFSSLHPARGMIAAVWDQRNHGDRKVSDEANESWRGGNDTHAQDMYGVIAGCVSDNKGLMDVVGGYLFLDDQVKRTVDQHLVLGVSLGGHTGWQLMFADERVEAGVMIIGCPDFMYLLQDRARLSKRQTFQAKNQGSSFFGSRDFPLALVEACKKADPKALVFGTSLIRTSPEDAAEEALWRAVLDQHRLRGKRFLSCSGKDDKLVPYAISKPFMDFFTNAAATWYRDNGLVVEDRVYEGVGHSFSPKMMEDTVRFLMEAISGKESRRQLVNGSKI